LRSKELQKEIRRKICFTSNLPQHLYKDGASVQIIAEMEGWGGGRMWIGKETGLIWRAS